MIRYVLACLLWLPGTAWAAVDLPFSTTFNCAEQAQGQVGTWVTCDGMSSYGGWTTSPGSVGEQITSAANHAAGGGGRGQRHWIGDGLNNNSGSIRINFNTPGNELWIRWYFRHESGLIIPIDDSGQKMLYFTGAGGSCAGNTGGCYFLLGKTTSRLTVSGTNYFSTVPFGSEDLWGGTSSDGQWHWVELHVKKVSTSGADGIVQAWYDGVLRLDRSDVIFGGDLSTGFTGFTIPENARFTTIGGNEMYQDIDDIEIRTTGPIGPLGGGGGGGVILGGMDLF